MRAQRMHGATENHQTNVYIIMARETIPLKKTLSRQKTKSNRPENNQATA